MRVDNEVESAKRKDVVKEFERKKIKTNKRLKEEHDFISKIQEIKVNELNIINPKQDDWIKKIKVYENKIK